MKLNKLHLSLMALTLLGAIAISAVGTSKFNFVGASPTYGCALPDGYHELADACA